MIGKNISKKKGFTLMELLIVIAILGILGVAFVPNILKAPAKARDAVRVKNVQDIHTAVEAYYAQTGKLPAANVNHCVDGGMATLLGMKKPTDPNDLGSCGTAGEYYYAAFNAQGVSVNDASGKTYVVGAMVEVPANANTKDPKGALTATPVAPDATGGTYFYAAGPV